MLFGSERFQKKFLYDVTQFAEEKNFILLYGALVGGISKGLQYEDSDYDTRFLYVNRENPQQIHIPVHEKETDLKHRIYFDNLPYEFIPLWEFTSFMQFLQMPAFDGKESCGLYNIIGWTMQSPYTWDPYGIGGKLVPLMRCIFHPDWIISFYRAFIENHFRPEDREVEVREYLLDIRAAMSIQWIRRFQTFAPVHFASLLAVSEEQRIREYVEKQCMYLREQSVLEAERNGSIKRQVSHYITGRSNREVDNWIAAVLAQPDPVLVSTERPDKEAESIVHKMLEIALKSVQPDIVGGV